VAFIDANKERDTDGLRWGVEPICEVLQFASSTYYAAKSPPECRRRVEDRVLKAEHQGERAFAPASRYR
jgi:putative transposase